MFNKIKKKLKERSDIRKAKILWLIYYHEAEEYEKVYKIDKSKSAFCKSIYNVTRKVAENLNIAAIFDGLESDFKELTMQEIEEWYKYYLDLGSMNFYHKELRNI